MNSARISSLISPFVKENKLTYDDFDKIFGFLPRREQYNICYAIQDELHIKLVDEIISDAAQEVKIEIEDADEVENAEETQLIVRSAGEIKMSNKLLVRLIQDGDEQARQDLCVKNSGLVRKFAMKYWKKVPHQFDLDDLIQEGNIGLITAAEQFDFSKATEFSTYATLWIVQKIMRAISNTGLAVRLPITLVQNILKASRLDINLQTQNIDLRKRIELIAAEMETDSEKVREYFKLRDIYFRIVSLDTPVGEDLETPLAELIPDEKMTPEDEVSLILLKDQVEEILSTLTPREREVLQLRFGLLDGKTRTLDEIGKTFKVTRERIRQIEAQALGKLRHPENSKKLKDFLD